MTSRSVFSKGAIVESSLNTKHSEPITVPLDTRMSVRLYSDCRPNCLETAALQKGLVLLIDGKEVIEEGLGFGVPIVKYKDKTFFCGDADVSVRREDLGFTLTKTYILDTVSLKKIGQSSYIDDGFYSALRKSFERIYLKRKRINFLLNKIMEIRQFAKIKTEFITVKPRGTIVVNYRCRQGTVDIEVDFSRVALTKCDELLVLNEQGSSIFQTYKDTSGIVLSGSRIGAWDVVKANQAYLQTPKGQISFSLNRIDNAVLLRGWERTRKRFSWAGLSYSILPSKDVFKYSIALSYAAS